MKKYVVTLLAACTLLSTVSVAAAEKSPLELEVTQGWRRDRFNAHAKVKGTPIHANASLKNINIYETRLRAKVNLDDYILRLDGGYGDVQHSRGKFSFLGVHGNHSITGGRTLDAKASFGKDCRLQDGSYVTPMIGYLWGEEKINFKNHVDPKLRWHAPFVGLGFKTRPIDNWTLYGEYNFAFVPMKKVKGYGNIGVLGIGYAIAPNVTLKAEYELSHMKAHRANHYVKAHASRTSSTGRLALEYAF